MTTVEKKVVRRFLDNIWPNYLKRREIVKEAGVEKLCSSLIIDYFTIIKKVVKNDLGLAAEKWLCPPLPGLKYSVKTKISQDILINQARIYAGYKEITSAEFLDIADVILSFNYLEGRQEIEILSISWSDLKMAEEIGGLRYLRTNYGFEHPEIAEYLSQIIKIMAKT